MQLSDILNIIIAGIPVECFALLWIWSIIKRRLPENIQAQIGTFVTTAVQMVEQLDNGSLTSAQKKQMAVQAIHNMLEAAHLPVPPDAIISDLIESAVYLLNLERGKLPAIKTGVVPAVRPTR